MLSEEIVGGGRDTALIVALFLSKYDEEALHHLEFATYTEAWNTLGVLLSIKPASIKNYRDEFDAILSTKRKGWYQREPRAGISEYVEKYGHVSFNDLLRIITNRLRSDFEVSLNGRNSSTTRTYSEQRQITGKAAERYFIEHYGSYPAFAGYELLDKRDTGCGYDFELLKGTSRIYVEVKGVNESKISFLLSEKEYTTADSLAEEYFLYIVSNFQGKPAVHVIQNPLNSGVIFQEHKKVITQISYSASL